MSGFVMYYGLGEAGFKLTTYSIFSFAVLVAFELLLLIALKA